jgi:peptide/nickel transport system substrate-binding protein/oligopeptide transport system substrate-binding protein
LNNQDDLFKNADLRRAVSLAINRQTICDVVWDGLRKPASSIIPSGLPGYEENAWQYCRYDVEAAKEMLAMAGYPNGEGLPTIKLSFNSEAGDEDVMQLVQADLKNIGINTEFDISDGPTYFDKLVNGKCQIGRSVFGCDYPTIDNFLSTLFDSASGSNFDQYKNEAVDSAITAARQIAEDSERTEAFQAIVRTIGDDCPEIPIATPAHERVASSRVHNLTYSPMTYLDFVSCWISQ